MKVIAFVNEREAIRKIPIPWACPRPVRRSPGHAAA
jgi:hypothetical protein